MSKTKFRLQERETIASNNHGRTILPMIFLLLFFAGIQSGLAGKMSIATAGAAEITYPQKSFDNGKAQHFTYKAPDGLPIRYFILKSSDGIIRAAFDACDVCWPAGKGYYQKGDFMICRNCGRKFRSTRVNEVQGGCNPAPLNRKVANGKVVIQTDDLLQGRIYFDFAKGGRK